MFLNSAPYGVPDLLAGGLAAFLGKKPPFVAWACVCALGLLWLSDTIMKSSVVCEIKSRLRD